MRLADLVGIDTAQNPEVARYEVTGVLGEGGGGTILLGHDDKLSREVAIKLLNADAAQDPGTMTRFHREARAMASLNHPNVLRVIDYSGDNCPVPFLVTERLVGHDLEQYIENSELSEIETLAVAHELCGALQAAHDAGIVHRDIKPQNIFLEDSGRVVLIDFGFAKGVRNFEGTFAASATALVGTPFFLNPEQCGTGGALSAQSDLFSLGSTLYYTVSQVLPFRGETMLDIAQQVVSEPPLPVSSLVDCTPAFEALLQELLQKNPAARPRSAKQVRQRCAEALAAAQVMSAVDRLARLVAARHLPPVKEKSLGAVSKNTLREELTQVRHVADTEVLTQVQRAEERIGARRKEMVSTRVIKMPARAAREPKRRSLLWIGAGVSTVVLAIAGFVLSQRQETATVEVVAMPTNEAPTPVAPTTVIGGEATLRFAIKPWGQIFVDGQLRGVAPSFHLVKLPLGVHRIDVKNPNSGTRSETVNLSVPNSETVLKIDFAAPAN